MKVIDVDVFESALEFADADVCEESPDGHCEFGFSRECIKELIRDIPDYRTPFEVECMERDCKKKHLAMDEKSLEAVHAICGATNLPCIKCNPGGCNNRKEGAD